MRKFNQSVVAAAVMTAALTAASGALAATDTTAHGASQRGRFVTQIHYTFDQGDKLADDSTVTNVGHPHFPGRVQTAFSGHFAVVPGFKGRGAGFPRQCATCGRGIIQASDRPGLDPGRRPISLSVALKATAAQAQGDSNVLQKGVYHQAGGQYKLQLDNGIPSCVMFGSRGRVLVRAKTSVANGVWHRVSCTRIRGTVTLRVNGHIVARGHGRIGSISNAAPVRVGGLALIKANDQYHGDLDRVLVRIKR